MGVYLLLINRSEGTKMKFSFGVWDGLLFM